METPSHPQTPHLERRFGLLPATALNMSNMVGVGPFITIPLLLSAMQGPQSILGWVVAFAITLADGMVWSELGAAMPGSGGSYVYLRECFGRETFGRLMAFLFIWQFVFSGPLEIASGYIGFSQYLRYLWPDSALLQNPKIAQAVIIGVAALVGVFVIVLLYRRITSIAKITVSLWVGTLLTIAVVLFTGCRTFDPKLAFDFPPGAFSFSWGFLLGLGAASRIGVYDFLGYYDICFIGDEVKNPGRVIPRSIFISLVVITVLYVGINLSLIGVVPWREIVDAKADSPLRNFVMSVFMERVYGRGVAQVFTVLILWTTVASCFALLLGYSRIPYAAARDGYFFKVFARIHPTKHFPHVSLLVIGVLSIGCCALSLQEVIDALVTTRIIVQFMGQAVGVILLRQRAPELKRPYRVWLYPLPNLLALVGWSFVFGTSGGLICLFSLAVVVGGGVLFLVWAGATGRWPFAAGDAAGGPAYEPAPEVVSDDDDPA